MKPWQNLFLEIKNAVEVVNYNYIIEPDNSGTKLA